MKLRAGHWLAKHLDVVLDGTPLPRCVGFDLRKDEVTLCGPCTMEAIQLSAGDSRIDCVARVANLAIHRWRHHYGALRCFPVWNITLKADAPWWARWAFNRLQRQ